MMSSRPSVVATAVATLVLAAAHHIYGGVVYATPWRIHGAVVALALAAAVLSLRRHRALVPVVAVSCVLAVGLFEGVYNHVLKNVLYLAHAPHGLLVRMFPPPTYEPPDDALFELTGVGEAVAGAACLLAMRERRTRTRLEPGARIAPRALVAVGGEQITLPDPVRLTHLQFRRFAGCPICNLHLRSFARRNTDLLGAGIAEVVVFHAPPDALRPYVTALPFPTLADPDKQLYAEFGVEAGLRAVLDPRVWATIVSAVAASLVASLRGREPLPALFPHGGRYGLPADFLIGSDGRILACHRGAHADDSWSVDDVLAARDSSPDAGRSLNSSERPASRRRQWS